MLMTLSVYEAKAKLSQAMATGEPFIITKYGLPYYEAKPIKGQKKPKNKLVGCMVTELKGFTLPEDFDESMADFEEELYGES
jgi:hypothetical protein